MMSDEALIWTIMIGMVFAVVFRRQWMQHKRAELIRTFLDDPERKERQGC